MNIICVCFTKISHTGNRTFSHESWEELDKIIMDKVLSNERTFAYATDSGNLKRWWSDCKECNWYKSEQSILSEARISI